MFFSVSDHGRRLGRPPGQINKLVRDSKWKLVLASELPDIHRGRIAKVCLDIRRPRFHDVVNLMPDNEILLRFMTTITITKTAEKTKSFLQNGK